MSAYHAATSPCKCAQDAFNQPKATRGPRPTSGSDMAPPHRGRPPGPQIPPEAIKTFRVVHGITTAFGRAGACRAAHVQDWEAGERRMHPGRGTGADQAWAASRLRTLTLGLVSLMARSSSWVHVCAGSLSASSASGGRSRCFERSG